MKISLVLLILIFICGFLFCDDFISPDEIKPGMKGYGLSVFKGWEPERFNVEVIDVMRNSTPKGDVILVRLSGANLEKSGVLAGMSGSPVYINGRLAGAVAFTWPYSKEPLCGLMPIGQMLRMKTNYLLEDGSLTGKNPDMQTIASPVSMQGFTGDAWKYVKENLGGKEDSNTHLFPAEKAMTAPGGDTVSDIAIKAKGLEAGDAVALKMVEGDFRLSAVGTVTYVSNNDVYVFGHPMDGSGKVEYPISRAYIFTVIPTGYVSFKLGGAAKDQLGAALFDGQSGIYCRIGRNAFMVPVELEITKDGQAYHYRFQVADSPAYFPILASGAISSALLNHAGMMDDKRISLNFEMNLGTKEGDKTVHKTIDYAFVPANLSLYMMLGELSQYLGIFYYNNLAEVQIKSVNVRLDIKRGAKYYTLEDAAIEKKEYYPGEGINCRLVLKEYQGNYIETNLTIKIPSNAKPGAYQLLFGNEKLVLGEVAKNFPRYYSINKLEDLIRMASISEDIKMLSVGLLTHRPGMQIREQKLEKFPEKYISYLPGMTEKGNALYYPELQRLNVKFSDAVFGFIKLPIVVANKKIQYPE